jgi:hypothetical protein
MAGAAVDFSTQQALDLWTITREEYPWKNRLEILQERHEWPVVNQWFQERKVTFESGTQIIHNVMIDHAGTARMILPNEPRTYLVGNVMARITIPWRKLNDYYLTNRDEVMRNRGENKLVDLLQTRRASTAYSMAELLETLAFKTPADSSDVVNPFGVRYWVTPITSGQVSAGTSGHQGSRPLYQDGNAITTGAGGIDSNQSKYSLWKNYNDVWTNADADVTDNDLDKIMGMLMDIKFKAPVTAKDVYDGTYDNFMHYSNKKFILSIERKARANNDNLGADIGKFAGVTRIKGVPVVRQDDLDDDSTNPLFSLNHDCFMPFILEGDFFRETGPMNDVSQPDTFVTNIDLQFNYLCTNRRKQSVINYPA